MKKKAPKVRPSYATAHNKAVNMYRKTSIFLLWAGILNFFSAIIGTIQVFASNHLVVNGVSLYYPKSGFALSFGAQIYLNSLFLANLNNVLAFFLIIITSMAFAALFAFFGIFASRGKWIILLSGIALYILDFVFSFFVYNMINPIINVWTNYAFTIATHVVILVALILAISSFYQVLDIEKKYKDTSVLKMEEEIESEEIAHGE